MTVGAPKGKTVAEPAPTKRDAVPGEPERREGSQGLAHALRHRRQCSGRTPTSITRLATWASGEDRLSLSVTE